MAVLIRMILRATGDGALQEFEECCRNPMATQEQLALRLLRQNEATAYGQAHDFRKVKSFSGFQKRVPIAGYDALAPYIQRALHGEPNQLTAERPVLFTTTSGTTGASKYIPVTPSSKALKSKLMRVWMSALHRDHPEVFSGKVLTMVSPEVESYAPCGTPCGAESGHGYRNMPRAVQPLYVAPYDLYRIGSSEAKYYALLRLAVAQPVRMIYTCNPSTVLKLAQRLGDCTEKLIRDVRDGTLDGGFEFAMEQLDPSGRPTPSVDIRCDLAGLFSPDPARAAELGRAAVEGGGRLLPRFVWPDFEVVGCWKGGTVGAYLRQFDDYFRPGTAVRDIGYFASEHRGSTPLHDDGDAGVLAIATNVYEFYPADRERKPDPTDLLTVDQIEEGKRYFVYVTTAAGLYRYDMNDIVEVTGFHESAPLIRFVQKGKGVVSFTGEKLYEAQALAAAEEVLARAPGKPEFIAAVGEMRGSMPHYLFLVEFADPPDAEMGMRLACEIDRALCRINSEYATKRKDRLDPAVLRIIRRGEYDRYRTRKCDSGEKNDGQFKILRLTADTKFLAEFVSLADYEAREGKT